MGLDEYLQQQSLLTIDVVEQNRLKTIDDYKSLVENLYEMINSWLSHFVEDKQISISRYDIDITEEKLGTYQIPALKISFAQKVIELKPKGAIMLGTDARIDVVYLGVGRKMIVRAPEKMTSAMQMIGIHSDEDEPKMTKQYGAMEWKLVDTSNRMQLHALDKETFEQLLVNIVTNG